MITLLTTVGIMAVAVGLLIVWASRDDWAGHVGIGIFLIGLCALILVGSVKFIREVGEIAHELPPKMAVK